jgi:tRNA/rRNA methyltransferase
MTKTEASGPRNLLDRGPAIILVEPQLGENIGTAARAMANFGLNDLRIVKPRDGWPNERARVAASRADHVLDAARVFASAAEAVADLHTVLGTTARSRELAMPVLGPEPAMAQLRGTMATGVPAGILFGRERIGLTNEELGLAEAILTLPVEPSFASLNVAQAVLLVSYEWRVSGDASLPFDKPEAEPASKRDLLGLFGHLEGALERAGFFRPPEKKPHMVAALRTLLQRASLTEQEVRTLRGVIAALEGRPTRPRRAADGTITTERGEGE